MAGIVLGDKVFAEALGGSALALAGGLAAIACSLLLLQVLPGASSFRGRLHLQHPTVINHWGAQARSWEEGRERESKLPLSRFDTLCTSQALAKHWHSLLTAACCTDP